MARRLASKAHGDNTGITRIVSMPHTGSGRKRIASDVVQRERRTIYPKSVLYPDESEFVLIGGHNQTKIGRDVRKGHLKGAAIYCLSLEERATCPVECRHWSNCYGNNMPFSKRFKHGPSLLAAIDQDLSRLTHDGRKILVRLHILGDFYSVEYVSFWMDMLEKYPGLHLFGYTARNAEGSDIGRKVMWMNMIFPKRSAIRFSNQGVRRNGAVTIKNRDECPPDAFICPQQTARTRACATCAACWEGTKNVAFLEH